jgi:hypothetical protein
MRGVGGSPRSIVERLPGTALEQRPGAHAAGCTAPCSSRRTYDRGPWLPSQWPLGRVTGYAGRRGLVQRIRTCRCISRGGILRCKMKHGISLLSALAIGCGMAPPRGNETLAELDRVVHEQDTVVKCHRDANACLWTIAWHDAFLADAKSKCEGGDADACVDAGGNTESWCDDHRPGPGDCSETTAVRREAAKWYRKACDLRNEKGCVRWDAIANETPEERAERKRNADEIANMRKQHEREREQRERESSAQPPVGPSGTNVSDEACATRVERCLEACGVEERCETACKPHQCFDVRGMVPKVDNDCMMRANSCQERCRAPIKACRAACPSCGAGSRGVR